MSITEEILGDGKVTVYFDSAATTKPSKAVIEKVTQVLTKSWGNPSSLHKIGMTAEGEIKKTAETLARALNARPEEFIFTSGGTESNNLAILGAAECYNRRGLDLVTTKIEHPSVTEAFLQLQKLGFNVTFLDVDAKGHIYLEQLKDAVTEHTILVSIMAVNNEIGTVQNIEKAGEVIKSRNPEALFHVDGVQSFGKEKLSLAKGRVDLLSFSGHKIHGIKGGGGLYIRKGVRLQPMLYGGEQQNKIRTGTENVPAIAAMGTAAEEAFLKLEANHAKVGKLRHAMLSICDELEGVRINGDAESGSPYILNLSFDGVRGEVLLHTLEGHGIYVSTGSACSKGAKSHSVIRRLDVPEDRVGSAVRFSFSPDNTESEVEYCIEILKKNIPVLRKYR